MDLPVEVELKYRLSSAAAGERWLNAGLLGSMSAAEPVRRSESEDRYVDTRDGALAGAGYAARLRHDGITTTISVKSLGLAEGSLQRRTEIEGPADGTLAPAAWMPSQARSFIMELCGDAPLIDLVTVRQVRRKRRFRTGSTVVELSLDEVEVLRKTRVRDQFTELEVELVEGPEAPLMELRTMLDADAELSPSTASKLDRALTAVKKKRKPQTPAAEPAASAAEPAASAGGPAASAGEPGRAPRRKKASAARAAAAAIAQATGAGQATTTEPAVAAAARATAEAVAELTLGRTPGVTADDVVAEAGRKVLRFHLARLIAREPGTRLGEEPEELHGMRVATRRMRAAWRVFGDGFRPEGTRKFRSRLRVVAQKLGAVRDIDVLILALEAYRADLPADEGQALEPLFDDWRSQREAARIVLTRELDSGGYRRFVDQYRAFVLTAGTGALVVTPTQPHHVRDTAGSRIWHAYEAVLAYGPVLRWADVPTLHQLRIGGKWLRYTLEFVAEALGPDARPLIERVVAMQDHLGLMNDAEVAAMKARALLVARTGTLSNAQNLAIARYLTSREREVARLKRGAAAPWRALASPVFRRGLGRAVATIAASPGEAARS